MRKAYRQMMKVLINEEATTVFPYQCDKDQTGWGSAVILGLLGVAEEIIYQDYYLTEQYNAPRNQSRMAIYEEYTDNSFVLNYLGSLQLTKNI